MRYTVAVAAILIATAPLHAQSLGERSGVNSVLGVSPKTADFVKEAAISDMFEIQSSQLAAERGDEATKTFATKMIADHQKTSSEMKEMVSSGKVKAEIPAAMDKSHQGKLDKLRSLQGADFNKRYRSEQVSAHKSAVNLFRRYGKGGDNPDLKAWAAKTQPALEGHLAMAQDLNKRK